MKKKIEGLTTNFVKKIQNGPLPFYLVLGVLALQPPPPPPTIYHLSDSIGSMPVFAGMHVPVLQANA